MIGDHYGQLGAAAVSRGDVDQVLPVDALGIGKAPDLHAQLVVVHLPGDGVGQHAAAVAVELAHEVPDHVGGGGSGVVVGLGVAADGGVQHGLALGGEAGHSVGVIGGALPVGEHVLGLGAHQLYGDGDLLAGDVVGLGVGVEGDSPVGGQVGAVKIAGVQEDRAGDGEGVFHGVLLQVGADLAITHQIEAGAGLEPLAGPLGGNGGVDIGLLGLRGAPSAVGGLHHEQAQALGVSLGHPAAILHKGHGVLAGGGIHYNKHSALGGALRDVELGGAGGAVHIDVHFQQALPQHGHHVVFGGVLGGLLLHQGIQFGVDQSGKLFNRDGGRLGFDGDLGRSGAGEGGGFTGGVPVQSIAEKLGDIAQGDISVHGLGVHDRAAGLEGQGLAVLFQGDGALLAGNGHAHGLGHRVRDLGAVLTVHIGAAAQAAAVQRDGGGGKSGGGHSQHCAGAQGQSQGLFQGLFHLISSLTEI